MSSILSNIMLQESITHVEDLPINEFIRTVESLKQKIVTEKLDGCLAASTILETLEFGEITISEIVDNKLYCHVKALSHMNDEIVFTPILAHLKTSEEKQWFRVTLESGQKLELTDNHPVWLPLLKCYRRTDELVIEDKCLID